jgi:hypothetical protein
VTWLHLVELGVTAPVGLEMTKYSPEDSHLHQERIDPCLINRLKNMNTAQEAAEARNRAEAEAETAMSEAEDVKMVLKDVSDAAEKVMAQAPAGGGVLSLDEETGTPVEDPRIEIQWALLRCAQRFIR